MPVDQHYDESDEKEEAGGPRSFKEFDCPSCNANNPVGEPFSDGDEVLCNYCGSEYRVIVSDEGRLRLKEI
ncbi:MAG: hypothetical protein ACOZIN_17505 [Myxococcota bacterium]